MPPTPQPWYSIANIADLPTPALVGSIPTALKENLRRMVALAGDVARLRPHVKTHKMPDVVRRKLAHGITKFKCATIAEAEMVAQCGAADVLLAYQPVGPNAARLARLAVAYPATRFCAVADDANAVRALSAAMVAAGTSVDVLLDLDVGMHRTGIAPGVEAEELYRLIAALPGLLPGGLHVTTATSARRSFLNVRMSLRRRLPQSTVCTKTCLRPVYRCHAECVAERRHFRSTCGGLTWNIVLARAFFGITAMRRNSPISTSCRRRCS